MKKFLILILICFVQNTYSQTIKGNKPSSASVENQVYNTAGIDVSPQFPGGINEFYKFIGQNYSVPKEKPDFVKGKVFTTFIIEKNGSISDVKILKDIGFGTGNEAL